MNGYEEGVKGFSSIINRCYLHTFLIKVSAIIELTAETDLISKFLHLLTAQSSEIRRRLSSELAVLAAGVQALTSGSITPCSTDTGYSDQRLDTPPSSMAGSSSSSQGGGGTPYSSRSGTPFSQDSGYSGGRLVFNVKRIESCTSNLLHYLVAAIS